ncbi:MAG: 8-amino-7-oxononanoate synthase [Ekhidna sp.]|nr:8-amino-7-oxononanoate synthase [Ekhidna sp.]MBC6427155.1 8-amino-7-oxononanoate synthase [Ekhidna sp.]
MNSYQKALEERKEQHLLRQLPLLPEGIDFYSNDYLGLAKSEALRIQIEIELRRVPSDNGSGGSRLLSGNSAYAERVENQAAAFHNAEAALIYPSGYTANLGLISCLSTRGTTLVMDELVHASLIDGARLGQSEKVRFRHNDVNDLESQLKKLNDQKVVIVESVYSMDGDICPLREVVEICQKNKAMIIVDEAHSMGIFGHHGSGLVQELGLEDKIMARIMTYGKAPGIHGAAVVGPEWLKDYQTNFSRSLIFSTAPAPHQFADISGMYSCLPKADKKRDQLKEIVRCFIRKRNKHEGEWLPSNSHIQSLIIPGNAEVVRVANKLMEAGINVLPIRRPSVPKGKERIRFCLHAYNTKEEIDLLFNVLKNFK